MTYSGLDYMDLGVAASLVVINAGLSIAMRMGLHGRMVFAAVRMVAQLGIVGVILKALFATASPYLTAAVALVMVLFAGREAMARQDRRFTGYWSYGLGTGSMMAAGVIVTVFGLTTQISPEPWYDPRYAIPILGMILGNTLNGVSLGLERLLDGAVRQRVAIEAQLALGADAARAMRPVVRDALRAGLIPTINSMAAAGVVSLPGMMTGQILAGVPPIEAVKYQILILFLIAGGTGLGLFVAVFGARQRIIDARHRLRLDRIV